MARPTLQATPLFKAPPLTAGPAQPCPFRRPRLFPQTPPLSSGPAPPTHRSCLFLQATPLPRPRPRAGAEQRRAADGLRAGDGRAAEPPGGGGALRPSGPAMGFLHQLQLLLWKNVTLKRRSPVSAPLCTRGPREGPRPRTPRPAPRAQPARLPARPRPPTSAHG